MSKFWECVRRRDKLRKKVLYRFACFWRKSQEKVAIKKLKATLKLLGLSKNTMGKVVFRLIKYLLPK